MTGRLGKESPYHRSGPSRERQRKSVCLGVSPGASGPGRDGPGRINFFLVLSVRKAEKESGTVNEGATAAAGQNRRRLTNSDIFRAALIWQVVLIEYLLWVKHFSGKEMILLHRIFMRRLLARLTEAARMFLFPDNRTAPRMAKPEAWAARQAGLIINPPVFKPFLVCGMERRSPARKWFWYTEDDSW